MRHRRAACGFSLVELLIAVVLAVIIFGAMVPLFVNILGRTSADELRVDATNIAQDRIEQVHLLAYTSITAANLNYAPSPAADPFGDGRFGPTYTVVGETRPYTITYEVTPAAAANAPQKYIKVSVSRPGESFVTTADTVIKNPEPNTTLIAEAEPTGLALTVWFDNYSYVKSPGVRMECLRVSDNTTTTVSKMPDPVTHEVTFAGLTGGPNYTYTFRCYSTKATYPLTAPPFRMWTSGKLKFDTYPGGD